MTRLAPDTQIRVSLIGSSERLHALRGDRDAAVDELASIAKGRTDLLAQAAGHFQGTRTWNALACYRLLVDAGADVRLIPAAAKQTAWNLDNYGALPYDYGARVASTDGGKCSL